MECTEKPKAHQKASKLDSETQDRVAYMDANIPSDVTKEEKPKHYSAMQFLMYVIFYFNGAIIKKETFQSLFQLPAHALSRHL